MNRPPLRFPSKEDPIVITGIGMITSVGDRREEVWRAVRKGTSGVRRLEGLEGIPDGLLIGAPVDIQPEYPGQLKVTTLALRSAGEALDDAGIDLDRIDHDRFGCAISAHMGDTSGIGRLYGVGRCEVGATDYWRQFLPNTACTTVANRYGLYGPRLCHSAACASGLIDILGAARAIEDHQCDLALAGSAEGFHPLFAAGFQKMRVLAYHDDPTQACRPFDISRNGFVMGEGAAMFVLERLSHAVDRGTPIYAQILGGRMLADAFHVTGMDAESSSLSYLISATLDKSGLVPGDVGYINAHGTGTQLNDVAETRGIRRALGAAANSICVSSTKSILGHLVNAAGSVELAITTLALRDGFAPPTMNLTDPDPDCDLDCIPLVGRANEFEHAMKVSIAFGGSMAAVALRRWPDCERGYQYPDRAAA
jgi:3-oxoacyl-[acyl-carrier-protein] synthase II